ARRRHRRAARELRAVALPGGARAPRHLDRPLLPDAPAHRADRRGRGSLRRGLRQGVGAARRVGRDRARRRGLMAASGEASEDGDMDAGVRARSSRWARVKAVGRWVLLLVGVGAVVWLIQDAGPDAVWSTLVRAGAWLPVVVACEIGFAAMDVLALRLIYGKQ